MFKRSENGQIWVFCYFLAIFSKTVGCFLYFLYIQLRGDDIDQLSRYGFDLIIQKVTFNVENVRFGLFSHNSLYYSVVTKCCPNVLHHLASLLWNQYCPKYDRCEITLKVIFIVRNIQFGPLWSMWGLKRYIIWSKFVWNTYRKSYMVFQFTL